MLYMIYTSVRNIINVTMLISDLIVLFPINATTIKFHHKIGIIEKEIYINLALYSRACHRKQNKGAELGQAQPGLGLSLKILT